MCVGVGGNTVFIFPWHQALCHPLHTAAPPRLRSPRCLRVFAAAFGAANRLNVSDDLPCSLAVDLDGACRIVCLGGGGAVDPWLDTTCSLISWNVSTRSGVPPCVSSVGQQPQVSKPRQRRVQARHLPKRRNAPSCGRCRRTACQMTCQAG